MRDEANINLVSVSVDGSHEDMGWHKDIIFLLSPKNPTVYLTSTSNYELFSIVTNDDKDKNY